MRGALHVLVKICDDVRIIPAYAGSTASRASEAALLEDHPRVCGEHRDALNKDYQRQGSSPRMRGAR